MTRTQMIVALFMLGSSAIAVAQTLPNAGFIAPDTPGMETGKLAPNRITSVGRTSCSFVRRRLAGKRKSNWAS